MKINNAISSTIISAAAVLLQPFIADLTPCRLLAALKAYNPDEPAETDSKLRKPYSVAEVQKLLGISKPSVYRMFRDGTLTQLKIRKGITRIPAEDIDRLLAGNMD